MSARRSSASVSRDPFSKLLGGLPAIPVGTQGDEAPHWLIPAKVRPMVLGDSRGAVYYYMNAENHMDGPYLPEPVKAQ